MEEKLELWFCPACDHFPEYIDLKVEEESYAYLPVPHCADCGGGVVRKEVPEVLEADAA